MRRLARPTAAFGPSGGTRLLQALRRLPSAVVVQHRGAASPAEAGPHGRPSNPDFSSDVMARVFQPFKWIRWRMNKIDSARAAYEKCSQAFKTNETFFVQELGLKDNFSSWFAITVLHVWIYTLRLRAEEGEGKELKQEIFNHLWLDTEIALHKAGVKRQLNKRIQNLLGSYYGQTLAYDEGLATNDAVFAAALWRNVFQAQQVKPTSVEALLTYVRRKLQTMEYADTKSLLDGSAL
ncbi:hypothetical protein SeLEV6574_g05722 [Synchytrium endobioticum]|nr:hypothetical protein SeLEV6574_g05722 [Synchytrium endobioticum]